MSVLDRTTSAEVVSDPFPHLVVKNVLDDNVCRQLLREYPSLGTITRGGKWSSNQRFSYSASKSIHDPNVSELWKKVIHEHISAHFLGQFIASFGKSITDAYPDFETRHRSIAQLRSGVRGVDSFNKCDILLDAQICVNTPVAGHATSVRKAHVDLPDKLFAGLFYLRTPEDDSQGGDLVIYRAKSGKTIRFDGQFLPEKDVEPVRVVPYENNVLVLFLNSRDAIHGVTPRSPTVHPRLFMNLVGEVREPLFDLPITTQPKLFAQFWKWMRRSA